MHPIVLPFSSPTHAFLIILLVSHFPSISDSPSTPHFCHPPSLQFLSSLPTLPIVYPPYNAIPISYSHIQLLLCPLPISLQLPLSTFLSAAGLWINQKDRDLSGRIPARFYALLFICRLGLYRLNNFFGVHGGLEVARKLPSKMSEVQSPARAEIWIEISAPCAPLGP